MRCFIIILLSLITLAYGNIHHCFYLLARNLSTTIAWLIFIFLIYSKIKSKASNYSQQPHAALESIHHRWNWSWGLLTVCISIINAICVHSRLRSQHHRIALGAYSRFFSKRHHRSFTNNLTISSFTGHCFEDYIFPDMVNKSVRVSRILINIPLP